MSELTTEQILDAALDVLQKYAHCPAEAMHYITRERPWVKCLELDDQGRYDETDGRCSPDRERECWRRYLGQEAHK